MSQTRDDINIRVKETTADQLHALKQRGDSYDDVIRRLIESGED